MARITFNQPLYGFDVDRAGQVGVTGQVVSVSNTHIVFSDGRYKSDLSGFFPQFNEDMGRFTGITYSLDDRPYITITGLNVKVTDTATASSLYSGNDQYIGSYGNDHFYAWPGDDTYSGGGGVDTVHYSALKSDFTIASAGTTATVKGLGKSDTLFDIERVSFGDGSTLALDVKAGQNAGSAYRLYEAAFDRKPDAAGLNYWIGRLDSGDSLPQIAQGFVESAEFRKLNPGMDATSIINSYYQNVLNRAPDAEGLKYWEGAMANGNTNAAYMLASFSESAENIANNAPALDGGLWLS